MNKATTVTVTLESFHRTTHSLTFSDHEVTRVVFSNELTRHIEIWASCLLRAYCRVKRAQLVTIDMSTLDGGNVFAWAAYVLLSSGKMHDCYNAGERSPSDVKVLSGRPRATSIRKLQATLLVVPEVIHLAACRWLDARVKLLEERGVKPRNFHELHDTRFFFSAQADKEFFRPSLSGIAEERA
jgi:hypothetical protein